MKKSLLYVSVLMLFYALGIVQVVYIPETHKIIYSICVGLFSSVCVLCHVFGKRK